MHSSARKFVIDNDDQISATPWGAAINKWILSLPEEIHYNTPDIYPMIEAEPGPVVDMIKRNPEPEDHHDLESKLRDGWNSNA
jgi:hypothetical protein